MVRSGRKILLSLSLLRTIGLPNLEDYLIKYLFEGFTDLEIRTGE